ncbi:MAG TPA: DoxX family protein [Solirubrobacteraceae bacterium]|nr:DoxX family protein [Solirubrobacteraceae bacterium]
MNVGRLLLRGVVGPLFVGHGTQKLFGWFDGHGPDATGGFFESIGLRPGKRHATAAGWSETLGGVLLTLGALTPVAQTLITGTMVTAIRKVHAQNGPWVTANGFEYNLTLIALTAALTETGPGSPSVDAALFGDSLKGKGWALAALAAGVAGSYLVTERMVEATPEPAPQEGHADVPGDPALEQQPRFEREPVNTEQTA